MTFKTLVGFVDKVLLYSEVLCTEGFASCYKFLLPQTSVYFIGLKQELSIFIALVPVFVRNPL